jgi:hypothetical protein
MSKSPEGGGLFGERGKRFLRDVGIAALIGAGVVLALA